MGTQNNNNYLKLGGRAGELYEEVAERILSALLRWGIEKNLSILFFILMASLNF